MPKIRDLVKDARGKVYIYCADFATCERFLKDCESEGITFTDGAMPTSRHRSTIYAVNKDNTINFVGTYGRMAYGAGASRIDNQPLIRIDYQKLGE